jgi:anaerobic selenocysteine-containing dehydrogenase
MCGMVVTTKDGRITDVRGDKNDVFSRGHICPKGPAMREILEDPDRLKHPVRRTKSGWQRISWDEALRETAERIATIQERDGLDAVGMYSGNPNAHNHGSILMTQAINAALGTRNRFDANSQDANPKIYVAHHMFGSITSLTVPDVDRTKLFLVLGANPIASNGSIMTLGDVRGRLRGIKERGGRIVVVDPRRTETAAFAGEHVVIRPGGDAALLFAMLHVMFAEDLVDRASVRRVAHGLDDLERAARALSPERVADRTGIAPDVVRKLARDFAKAKAAVCYGRIGVCLNEFGALASWLCEAINVVSGNFDRPGGAMFTNPGIDLARLARLVGVGGTGRGKTRVRGLLEVGGMLPASAMAEEIETPGEGQIKGFVTFAGNPVLSVPNGERVARALSTLEFMVSIDFYLNETTRLAHVVLPPRFALERGHFDVLFNALAVRNVVKWSAPVVEPEEDTRDDWTILRDLSARLAARKRLGPKLGPRAAELAAKAARAMPSDERVLDLLLRVGPHRLSLAKVKAAPHGIDLGPLVPMGKERVVTADHMIALAPKLLLDDVPRLEAWLARAEQPELVLIGRRHLRSNNSWMHNVRSLTKGPDRAQLFMHPDDAKSRGLADGARVRVKSRVGVVDAKLELTADVGRGVVSLPHGFGHAAARDTMKIAGALEGPSMNAITDDALLEPLTSTAILNGMEVDVESAT